MSAARLLVCGGRAFTDADAVDKTLTAWQRSAWPIACVITGGARGADTLAAQWAERNGIQSIVEKARWEEEGRAAGPLRNQRMIDQHHPTHVIAFPGGRGTADMVRRARAAGIPVITVTPGATE